MHSRETLIKIIIEMNVVIDSITSFKFFFIIFFLIEQPIILSSKVTAVPNKCFTIHAKRAKLVIDLTALLLYIS